MSKNTQHEKLRKFLNLLWLRPENALRQVFKSEAFAHLPFHSPSLDLSCGNGLFLFFHFGGELESSFDYFSATRAQDFRHTEFIDIYDYHNPNSKIPILQRATQRIDYGSDWKKGLLATARATGIYDNLIQHDNNSLPLPFEDNYFRTVYSNSIYWVEDTESLVNDIFRILSPTGTVILEVAGQYFLQPLEEWQGIFSEQAIRILDRNRRSTMPGIRSYYEWEKLFEQAGFTIVDVRNVYPAKLISQIWNVGLRPISHLLIQMADELDAERREDIKTEWVEIFLQLLTPLLDLPEDHTLKDAAYFMFELKK